MKKRSRKFLSLTLSLSLSLALTLALPATRAAETAVTEILPCEYDQVTPFSEGLAAVCRNGKWGFVDRSGKEVIPCQYDFVGGAEINAAAFSEGLAAVRMGDWETGKWGYIDTTGREVIPLQYTDAGNFSEGLANVRNDSGKYAFIDKAGREVTPYKYDSLTHPDHFSIPGLSEGFARVGVMVDPTMVFPDYDWGFINATGEEVVPCKYSSVEEFSEGYATVSYGNAKYGYVDTTGKEITPCQYDGASYFSEGLARVFMREGDGYRFRFIDGTGREVLSCDGYQNVGNFSEGLAYVVDAQGKVGFMDKTGNLVISCTYAGADDFSEGVVRVKNDASKFGFIDKTGKEVVPCQYANGAQIHEGFMKVVDKNGKWGVYTATGELLVPCTYDDIDVFSENFAAVCQNGKWGFIDTNGKEIIPCQYNGAENFSEGLAAVRDENGKWGFIDAYGKEVVPCKYDFTWQWFPEGYAVVNRGGKYGILAMGAASQTAYPSTQTVLVDGKSVTFNAYALKDENGNDTNYVKLRDVADIINGSAAQFEVGWDGSISITTHATYTPNGSEGQQTFSGDQDYALNTSPVKVDGADTDLEAITLTDTAGGGYTYFKLRDLGAALGFQVSWDAAGGQILIDTTAPYQD